MAQVKPGDVVKLNSGSTLLTVDSLGYGMDGSEIKVIWFHDFEMKSAIIKPDSVQVVED